MLVSAVFLQTVKSVWWSALHYNTKYSAKEQKPKLFLTFFHISKTSEFKGLYHKFHSAAVA